MKFGGYPKHNKFQLWKLSPSNSKNKGPIYPRNEYGQNKIRIGFFSSRPEKVWSFETDPFIRVLIERNYFEEYLVHWPH